MKIDASSTNPLTMYSCISIYLQNDIRVTMKSAGNHMEFLPVSKKENYSKAVPGVLRSVIS